MSDSSPQSQTELPLQLESQTTTPRQEQQAEAQKSFSELLRERRKNFKCQRNGLRSWPYQITSFKKDCVLDKGNLNQRHIGLCIATLGVALLSIKFQPQVTRVLRNTIVTYYFGGIFITPEICNPFLVFRYKGEPHQN